MKLIVTLSLILIVFNCSAQEPTPFAFNFRIIDNKGKVVMPDSFSKYGLRIFFTDRNNSSFTCKEQEILRRSYWITYDSVQQFFSVGRLYTHSCEPFFLIIQGNDSMFIKVEHVLDYSCYEHLPNGSPANPKSNCSRALALQFGKGYYINDSLATGAEKGKLEEYFREELSKRFCLWIEVKAGTFTLGKFDPPYIPKRQR